MSEYVRTQLVVSTVFVPAGQPVGVVSYKLLIKDQYVLANVLVLTTSLQAYSRNLQYLLTHCCLAEKRAGLRDD